MRQLGKGLWHWTAPHPEWTEDAEWPGPDVSSYACETAEGVALFDPLVEDWGALDALVGERPVAVLLTVEWHERSAAGVRERYRQAATMPGVEALTLRQSVGGDPETLYWLPEHAALVAGDSILGADGSLALCPPSWVGGDAQLAQLKHDFRALLERPVERVLVTHGGPLLTGGRAALERLLARDG